MDTNDVWGTITKAIDTYGAVQIAKATKPATTAAPSGAVGGSGWSTFNPFPGMFSSTPQADGKVIAGSAPSAFGASAGGFVILAIIGVVLALILRR